MEAALLTITATAFIASAGAMWRLGSIVGGFRGEIGGMKEHVATSRADHAIIFGRLDAQGNRITALEVSSRRGATS